MSAIRALIKEERKNRPVLYGMKLQTKSSQRLSIGMENVR